MSQRTLLAESRIRCSCLRENQTFVREANSPKLFVSHLTVLIKQFWVCGFETCSVVRCAGFRSRRWAHHPKSLQEQARQDSCVSDWEETCDHCLFNAMLRNINNFYRWLSLLIATSSPALPPPRIPAQGSQGGPSTLLLRPSTHSG